MKILVTGGAGFIASHLVDQLVAKKHQVVVIDNLSSGRKENLNPKAKFYKADIRDKKISRIFKKEKPQIVFHFAANISIAKSLASPMNDAAINVLGTLNVLENCKNYKVKKYIFSSSCAIYGQARHIPTKEEAMPNLVSPYAISKLAGEDYAKLYFAQFGLPFAILRFANVYGPRQQAGSESGVVAAFCSKKQPLIYGNGRQTRDFVYVGDVVAAAIAAGTSSKTGTFNIGTQKETSINTLFDMVKKERGGSLNKKYIKGGEGQKRSCLDISKAKTQLRWQPLCSLAQGLKLTITSWN